MTTINRKELIIGLNDEGFRRRDIQGVANALYPNVTYTTLHVKKFNYKLIFNILNFIKI